MVHLADVYRILEKGDMILSSDQFNLATLGDECWGPVDKFAGHRVREVHERGKILFRRLEAREMQV